MSALRVADRPPLLTDREQRVLAMIAEGKEIREMAREMRLAERTIKGIIQIVLFKLGARNRAHAVALAIADGWLLTGDRALILAKHHVALLEQENEEMRKKLERVRRAVQ